MPRVRCVEKLSYFFLSPSERANEISLPLEIELELEQKPLEPEHLVFFSARTSWSDGGIFSLKLDNYSNYINFCSDLH